jgi:YD repeat-containing protein
LKVGYDGNADDDIDDAGDDLVVSSPFGSTAITPSHDDNGNLTDDGTYKYTYDAWNRLVKATLNDTDITIQQAEFDGLGRRIKKTVTNSGDLDGTTVYLYNRHQIIETRNGSDEVTLQVYPGTRYIDEVVGLRVKDQGRLYAHQDANWNVTGLTDLTGRVIEQYWYSPTGSSKLTSRLTPSTSTTMATWTPRTSQPGRQRRNLLGRLRRGER